MIYKECEYCGATLDAGEKCDCRNTVDIYMNSDHKCECSKCEKKTCCPYHDKYQRLSRHDAPDALGLCPKLPESYRK